MKIRIVSVGKIKDKALQSLIDGYTKQIKEIEIIEITDEKDASGILKEGKNILAKLDKEAYTIALAIEGETLDSVSFATMLDRITTHQSPKINVIIGGSYGLSDEVKKRADYLLSLSKMTFPHQLTRLILVEQIYRAMMILKNHPYHK